MIEKLNFEKHSPEEYRGKMITFNNCDYIIGDYVGSGMSKIVHKLINFKSHLTLHIIKIYRTADSEKSCNNEVAAFIISKKLGLNNVPEILKATINDRVVAIEQYIGPYEDESNETRTYMAEGDNLISEKEFLKATLAYKKVLVINNLHSVALNNIAYAFAQLEKFHDAFGCQLQAVTIEPNDSEYRKNLIQFATSCGRLSSAEYHFEELKKLFPWYDSLDNLMLQVFRHLGKPEKVKGLTIFDKLEVTLKKEVEEEIELKRELRKITDKAKTSLFQDNYDLTHDLLSNVSHSYGKPGMYKMNLAFSYYRKNDFSNAINLLQQSISLLHHKHTALAYLNISFCYIKLQQFENAYKFLKATASLLFHSYSENNSININDLPSIGAWIDDEGTIEKPLINAYKLIEVLVSITANVDFEVKKFFEMYREAYEIQEKSFE